jgi:hypothetical protein
LKLDKNQEIELSDYCFTPVIVSPGLTGFSTPNFFSRSIRFMFNFSCFSRSFLCFSRSLDCRYPSNVLIYLFIIDNFGDYIRRQREVLDTLRKTIVKSVLDHITVDYDLQEKVHRLYINFRISVFYGVNGKENGKSDKYLISRPLKTLVNPKDQPSSVENYSTVTDFARFLG